ncbi:MAG: tRNA (N6-threonylcarbamoyladenosine(37)-N6)-methyltransferase TrmO [Spirochaetes bacterium]|nr:tRNA (N6-threonylcarbamoyladenosine(37)-N6)-methyltransferase TrmO [Spirochaetota bacterium]
MKEIKLHAIGEVSSPIITRRDENWGEVISKIVLIEEYKYSLLGIEDFSHAIIVTYLHEAKYDRNKHLQRRPRNLDSMPLLGIFSQRGKNRPNPIGITAVKIVSAGEDFLEVKGLDAINGTPILDIKPYYPQYDMIKNSIIPDWVNHLMENYF